MVWDSLRTFLRVPLGCPGIFLGPSRYCFLRFSGDVVGMSKGPLRICARAVGGYPGVFLGLLGFSRGFSGDVLGLSEGPLWICFRVL